MGFFITTPELKASFKKYLELYTNDANEYNELAFHAFKVRLEDRAESDIDPDFTMEDYNKFLHEIHCEEWYNECSRTIETFMTKEDIEEMMCAKDNNDNLDYVGSLYDLDIAIRTGIINL